MRSLTPSLKPNGEDQGLRLQGQVFCGVAMVGVIATPWLASIAQPALSIAVLLAIFFLGIPHGALDTLFATHLYAIRSPLQWSIFVALYVLLAAAIVALWWWHPNLFLAGFLLISAFHFSGDPVIELPIGARLLYGSSILVLPSLFHAPEITVLFSSLVSASAANQLTVCLQSICTPLLIADAALIFYVATKSRLAAAEIVAVVLLALVASPLIAFALFFCGMHSPRHFLRAARLAGVSSKTLLLRAAVLPTLACTVVFGLALIALPELSLEQRLVRVIFVGLAALTVPHMWLVERVRFQRR